MQTQLQIFSFQFNKSLTLVVFDGKIRIVQHLRDEPIVKVVALNWIIFVHGADGLDYLVWRQRNPEDIKGKTSWEKATYSLFWVCCHILLHCKGGVSGSHLIKYVLILGVQEHYQWSPVPARHTVRPLAQSVNLSSLVLSHWCLCDWLGIRIQDGAGRFSFFLPPFFLPFWQSSLLFVCRSPEWGR